MKKKLLAMLLTFSMLAGLMPETAVHAAEGPQDGQVEYVGGTTSTDPDATYGIEISKTIEAIEGKENYFDITLTATTKRHKVDLSTDVIVVMDISNTMNDPITNGTTAATDKKLYQAKAATNTFISQFATNDNLDENRKIGVVTFNTDAQVAVPLTEANDYYDFDDPNSTDDIYAKVNAISAPGFETDRRFTNVEAGLRLAGNLLEESEARYKYIILLTDGFPTTYIQSGSDSTTNITGYLNIMGWTAYDASRIDTDGYFANTRLGRPCCGGVNYSNKGAEKASAVAAELKASGMNIFSVGIDLYGQSISGYLESEKNYYSYSTIDTTGMEDGESYVIGDTYDTYRGWLENSIAGGTLLENSNNRYSDGDNQAELESDFAAIMYDIEHAPETTMREFYTLDPMSDIADFISFYDKDGNLAADPNRLTGESKQNAEDTAVYSESDDAINWNLLASGYTMDGEKLVFDITYRVRLKNEKEGFSWSTAYRTNDTTTLNYSQKYEESGEDVPGGSGQMEYDIPEIEGYCGELEFVKVDADTGEKIPNVTFTLQHYGDNCSVCEGDADIPQRTAVSDENGKVSFSNIPSGHEYILIETVPDGYAPIHNHAVIVSYGETYIGTKSEENKLVDGKLGGVEFTVKNTKVEPVELQLQVSKTLDGSVPEEGAFVFLLSGTGVDGVQYHEHVRNDEDGKATFSRMILDVPGTYNYTISEVAGSDTGIVYDAAEHTVQIVVEETENGFAYQASVSVDGGEAVTYVGEENTIELIHAGSFINASREAASVVLKAEKNLLDVNGEATALTENQFSFVLKDSEGTAIETVGNRADGTVEFSQIEYDTPGIYTYTISEASGTSNEILPDNGVYTVIVKVTAPEDLTSADGLTAEVTYRKNGVEVESAAFTNKERKLPELSLTGLKTLNGEIPAAGEFQFRMVEFDRTSGTEKAETEQIVSNDANGLIHFEFDDIIAYMAAQELESSRAARVSAWHQFNIYEVPGESSVNGEYIEYDGVSYRLYLNVHIDSTKDYYPLSIILTKVDENGDESVIIRDMEGSYSHTIGTEGAYDLKFENTSKVKVNLEAVKKYEKQDGTALDVEEGQFIFILHDENGNEIETVTNAADGSIAFGTLEFDVSDVGTHRYVIHENTAEADRDKDIFYDESLFTAEFEVKMDENGHLSVEGPTYTKNRSETVEGAEFVNKQADPTHFHLTAVKTVNGHVPTENQNFNFKMELVQAPAGVEAAPEWNQTVGNVLGRAVFEHIEFGQGMEGTYVFKVSEEIPETANAENGFTVNGMTYDTTVYTVTIVVASDEGDVTTSVTIQDQDGNILDGVNENTTDVEFHVPFDNAYTAEPVDVNLEAVKTLDGRTLNADEFRFELKDAEGAVLQTKTNAADGSVVFDTLTYTEAGTYKYTVTEVSGALGGVTYDETVYMVTVKVTDNGQGALEALVTVNGRENAPIEFKNRYTAEPAYVIFAADKVLEGRSLNANEFSFELYEGEELLQTVTNAANGRIIFHRINYTTTGSHTYTVKEVRGNLGGIIYDETVKEVTVDVVDNGEGRLVAKVGENPVTMHNLGTFTNRYEAAPVPVALEAAKILDGRTLNADEFSFELKDAEGEVLQTKTNAADGSVVFDVLNYEETGTYTYTVNEVRGTLGGVTYDETVYNVEVTVTDNGVGQLEAAVAITAGGETKEEVVFNNTYAPDDTSVVLKATKVFVDEDGKKEAMKGGEFTFQLKAADGTVLDQAVNAADGSVVFDAVTYDEEGQFTYTISEVIGNNNSIIYDKTVYTVVVVVEDNEEGKLEVVSVEYKKANAAVSEAKFVNRSEDKGIVPTGDNNHIMIWIALLGISGIGTAVLMKRKKVNK